MPPDDLFFFLRRVLFLYLCQGGQVDGERRAAPNLGVDADLAVMLADDAIDLGQPQPCALAKRLGGIEGLEEVGHDLIRDACAGVGYGECDPFAGGEVGQRRRTAGCHAYLVEMDRQLAAIGHGVSAVDNQVEQSLLDLRGITPDPKRARSHFQGEAHVLRDGALKDGEHLVQEVDQVQVLLQAGRLPREIQDALDEMRPALCLLGDMMEVRDHIGGQVRIHEL